MWKCKYFLKCLWAKLLLIFQTDSLHKVLWWLLPTSVIIRWIFQAGVSAVRVNALWWLMVGSTRFTVREAGEMTQYKPHRMVSQAWSRLSLLAVLLCSYKVLSMKARKCQFRHDFRDEFRDDFRDHEFRDDLWNHVRNDVWNGTSEMNSEMNSEIIGKDTSRLS